MATKKKERADDGYTTQCVEMLDERIHRIERMLDAGTSCTRGEITKFVWSTAKAVRKCIKPEGGGARIQAWADTKGMLKEIIDFTKFTPATMVEDCVHFVLERKIFEVLERYKTWLLTGEIQTKWPPPKLLGETDLVLCVDKPCQYLCEYGGNGWEAPKLALGSDAKGPSELLNLEGKQNIQIHEYLALKYQFETALETRKFWASGSWQTPCKCGKCVKCATFQTGCCNRLDKETSGVMICAKTCAGFEKIRAQFASNHVQEEGGIEKYYICLTHGEMDCRYDDQGACVKGRVGVTAAWDPTKMVMVSTGGDYTNNVDKRGEDGEAVVGETPQKQLTFYWPLAWYTHTQNGDKYTLVLVQIITGRRHQIRFHMNQVGHPIVSDFKYGAPRSDMEWANRMFLHSYKTKFLEPFTNQWYEACSPLPPELSKVMEHLTRDRSRKEADTVLMRRDHPTLAPVLKQYDPTISLLNPIGTVANPEAVPDLAVHDPSSRVSELPQVSTPAPTQRAPSQYSPAPPQYAPPQHMLPQQPQAPPPMSVSVRSYDGAKRQRVVIPQQFAGAAPMTPPDVPPPAAAAAPAQWKRMASRSQAGVFYYFNEATGQTQVDPPHPWIKQESRSQPGVFYYWNQATMVTSVDKPEV